MDSNEKPAPTGPSAAELADLAWRVRERLSDYLDPDTVAYAITDVMTAVAAAGWLSPASVAARLAEAAQAIADAEQRGYGAGEPQP